MKEHDDLIKSMSQAIKKIIVCKDNDVVICVLKDVRKHLQKMKGAAR